MIHSPTSFGVSLRYIVEDERENELSFYNRNREQVQSRTKERFRIRQTRADTSFLEFGQSRQDMRSFVQLFVLTVLTGTGTLYRYGYLLVLTVHLLLKRRA
jgi:hypothetical protein